MPAWKKVITSGSDASLNSLTVTNGVTGSLLGTASNATAAATINVTLDNATNASYYPVFTSGISGNQVARVDNATLTYNPGNNTLTTTTFAGTATNATNVAVTNTTTGVGPYYVMFADATTGNIAARVDSAALTFNATTNVLTTTASHATQALSASYAPSAGLTGGTANYIPLWTSTSAISSSALFQSASNIGINKILPSASLDVTGVIRGMYDADPGGGGSITAKFVSYAPSPFGLLFRGYSTGLQSIQSQREFNDGQLYDLALQQLGGNVAIGKTFTNSKLDVNGNTIITGSLTVTSGITGAGTGLTGITNSNLSGTAGITNANLANSSITIGSTAVSLGSSATTIAGLTSVTSTTFVGALTGNASTATTAGAWTTGRTITIGSTGKTVDGSGNVSWTLAEIGAYANTNPSGYTTNTGTVTSIATAGTVSGITLTGGTITGAGTITLGGSISGLTNSNLSGTAGITNANLANSSVTVGSTAISLGSSATTIAGLSSVTSTTFVGALTGNASTATTSGLLTTEDNRTISPSELTTGRLNFGFTSWANNNTSPYADFLHLRSYSDGSGGNDNLVMFRKDAIGMRIWQQTYGSATAYSSFKDVAWTDGTNASGTWGIGISGNAATATALTSMNISQFTNNSGYTTNTGTVTSVATSGTVNGITLTGGTITSTGTITLGGTLSGIGNAQLTNSSVTVGSTAISLGSSATTIAGLSSVTSTTFVGALTGNASTATSATSATSATTATNATNIAITDTTTTAGTYYPVFVSATTGNVPARTDSSTFTYNPNTNTLTVGTVSGTLSGNASTATTAGSATGNAGSVTYLPNRTDGTAYPVLWGAAYTNTIGTIAYSAAAVTIQSSTGTLNATNLAASTQIAAPIFYDSDNTAYNVNPAATTNLWICNAQSSISAPIFYNVGSTSYYVNPGSVSRLNSLENVQGITSQGAITATSFVESSNSAYYFDGGNTGDSIRTAGNIVAYYSDERLKDKKGNIENALEKLLTLNGFYYEPNERAQELGYKKKLEIGVSAQEVEAVLPEIVNDAPIGYGYKTLDYSKLVPLLIEAIKEQQKQIDELKSIK